MEKENLKEKKTLLSFIEKIERKELPSYMSKEGVIIQEQSD